MSERTTHLRQLAEDHNAAGFEINFSSVSVYFYPGDDRATNFANAVARYDKSIGIRREVKGGRDQIKLSLG